MVILIAILGLIYWESRWFYYGLLFMVLPVLVNIKLTAGIYSGMMVMGSIAILWAKSKYDQLRKTLFVSAAGLAHRRVALASSPMMASPGLIVAPSMIFDFSTTPTANPARSYLAVRIHRRHFRRFPADQRATCLAAAFGDARDHLLRLRYRQLSRGEVVKKEERFRSARRSSCPSMREQIMLDTMGEVGAPCGS
jgi:hypothetical protein